MVAIGVSVSNMIESLMLSPLRESGTTREGSWGSINLSLFVTLDMVSGF
jgi:hypothetical protein